MELWIRSQDKELLLKPICFEIDEEGKNTFLILTKIAQNYNDICVGLYKTEERALEILDEMQELLESPQRHIEGEYTYYMPNDGSSKIYEMPKE